MSSRILLILPVLLGAPAGVAAQELGRIRVEVRAGAEAVAGATVVVAGTTHVTDAAGVALVPRPPGRCRSPSYGKGSSPSPCP